MKDHLKDRLVKSFQTSKKLFAFISENEKLTYEELLEEANHLTNIIKNHQITPSAFISLEVKKNRDFLVALVASIFNDLILIPQKYDLTNKDKEKTYSICFPEYSLTKENSLWQLNKTEINRPLEIKSVAKRGGFIRPTSGTTSSSKGVYISSLSALNRVEASIEALEISTESAILCLMSYPFHFIASLLSFLSVGACILTPDSFDEASIRSICNHVKPTHLYASPYHYAILSEMDLIEELRKTSLLISTGTKLPESTRAKFEEKYSKHITEIFGIIEIGLALKSQANETLLTPAPHVEVGISPQSELLLKGEGMLDAYLSPFKTRSEILDNGWFNTGDIIEEVVDNRFKILGRSKSVIHIGAHKVFPEEIEEQIMHIEGVIEAKVYGIPHDLFGSEIKAEIISSMPLDEKEIISYLRKSLGSLKCPKKIDFVDSIELTNSGKIKRS